MDLRLGSLTELSEIPDTTSHETAPIRMRIRLSCRAWACDCTALATRETNIKPSIQAALCSFFHFAQRAFCAARMRAIAEADNRCFRPVPPLVLTLSAATAASNLLTRATIRLRSCCSCFNKVRFVMPGLRSCEEEKQVHGCSHEAQNGLHRYY